MTADSIRFSSNVEIAKELLTLRDRDVVDIGCGEGKFTRFLASQGARVVGLDANEKVLAKARAALKGEPVEYVHGRGEAMPFADASKDIVVFSNSLHHVAPELMQAALKEAVRVLKPGGRLYVMEPVAEGNWFEANRPLNDETAVRNAAYAALKDATTLGLAPEAETSYRVRRRFDSYEAWRTEQVEHSDKRRALVEAQEDALRERFFRFAVRDSDGALAFDQRFRVNLLKAGF